MKYRWTPLNIFCAFLVGLEILFFVFPESLESEHYGYQHIFLIPVIVVGLLTDFILQRTIKKYTWIVFIQVILIVAAILLNVDL